MDPLSLTASLIAVLQISGTIISALYEYRTCVKDASKDAARVTQELNGLRSVLESILQAVEKEQARPNSSGLSRLSTFEALTQRNSELERCREDLESISKKLGADRDVSSWKTVGRSLVWPFKTKEIDKLLQGVQRAKSTMNFALSTDQAVMTLEIHEGVESLSQQFRANSLDAQRSKIYDWIAAPDPFSNHVAA